MVDGMTRSPTTRLLHETVHFLLGLIALTVLTASCFWLDVGLVSTAFTYLILILLLSLAGGFIPLIALSFIAVASLNYFFAPPIFSLHVEYLEDIITVTAFLITSLMVTGLVRRTRVARDELAHVVDGIPALVWNMSSDGAGEFLINALWNTPASLRKTCAAGAGRMRCIRRIVGSKNGARRWQPESPWKRKHDF